MKNILCFIEARMGSSRFPGKVLKKVNKNYRVIDYVLNNPLNSKYFNNNNIFLKKKKKLHFGTKNIKKPKVRVSKNVERSFNTHKRTRNKRYVESSTRWYG